MKEKKIEFTKDELITFRKLQDQITNHTIAYNKRLEEMAGEANGFFDKKFADNLEQAKRDLEFSVAESQKWISHLKSKYGL